MSASELSTYVSAQRAAGVTDASIRAALLSKGWPVHEINEALGADVAPIPLATPTPARTGSKLALTLGLVAMTAAYALWQVFGTNTSAAAPLPVVSAAPQQPSTAPQPQTQPSSEPSSQTKSPPGNTNTTDPTSPPKPKGQYADGTYTGSVADAYYGNVQVQAVIQGGKLTNVRFLQYPNSHGTSVYINQQAMPYLTQEAIQAQSAQVDGVSGATATSQAFVQSLSSALAKAKA